MIKHTVECAWCGAEFTGVAVTKETAFTRALDEFDKHWCCVEYMAQASPESLERERRLYNAS